ncbi:hypothetical protein PHYPSEUDO_009292 [Phytophthora pseudosyringae]|uniref:Uncharacterized protein n=1 Tax=Phytophthora pseudosyringae TaxID=221518 RepID=A0A8T1VFB2_9STRA|nr:hypothetical protein PHYPSEUDO_009292 [Phytophthora pseudosyringae]
MLQEAGGDAEGPSLCGAEPGRCCGECVQLQGRRCHVCRRGQEEAAQAQEKHVESFDFGSLGPPPPCATLCRQKATDCTAARERKRADLLGREPEPHTQSRVLRRLSTPRADHYPLMRWGLPGE